jgi:hypothetical protein
MKTSLVSSAKLVFADGKLFLFSLPPARSSASSSLRARSSNKAEKGAQHTKCLFGLKLLIEKLTLIMGFRGGFLRYLFAFFSSRLIKHFAWRAGSEIPGLLRCALCLFCVAPSRDSLALASHRL